MIIALVLSLVSTLGDAFRWVPELPGGDSSQVPGRAGPAWNPTASGAGRGTPVKTNDPESGRADHLPGCSSMTGLSQSGATRQPRSAESCRLSTSRPRSSRPPCATPQASSPAALAADVSDCPRADGYRGRC